MPEATTGFCKKSGATHDTWTPQGLAPPNWQKQVLRAKENEQKNLLYFREGTRFLVDNK